MSNDIAAGKAKQVGGEFQKLGGKAREGIANITGDDKAKAYAKRDQAAGEGEKLKGEAQEAWGKTKKAVADAIDD